MWKTIATASAAAVVIGGAGTAAFAAGTDTPTPSATSTSSASQQPASGPATSGPATKTDSPRTNKARANNRLRGAVHATWVSKNKKSGEFTTHAAIRGQVTALSATSITVRAADRVTETYVLTSATKVRSRAKKAATSITDIKTGDPVLVMGTGTTTLTASRVVDAEK
jgi:hypothetical protein